MSKVILLCCILLPVVCHGTCAPGEDSCNIMDEAALVQKDLSLAQKSSQAPADIDRATAAKHISEALSLQYLAQSNEAKLEQAKQLQKEFNGDEILAATTKYKDSKHSEADFEAWYDVVSEGFGKIVKGVGSKSKAAEADLAAVRKTLDKAFDRLEEATTYADSVTQLAVASQLSSQASFIAKPLVETNDNVLNAMEKYQEQTEKGFVEKKFVKALGVINQGVTATKTQLETFVKINEQKVKEVKDAKLQFTARTGEDINKALFQLIAMDKSIGRTEVANHVNFGFMARQAEMIEALKVYSQSERAEADLKKLRSGIEGAMAETESMIKALNDVDKKGEKEAKDVVLAAFSNLSDEGEFAQKIMKFATHWGRQRLQSDLLNLVQKEQANLKTAFDSAASMEDGKAFGKVYGEIMTIFVTLKSQFSAWVTISDTKQQQLKDDNLQLNAWLKQ